MATVQAKRIRVSLAGLVFALVGGFLAVRHNNAPFFVLHIMCGGIHFALLLKICLLEKFEREEDDDE